MKATIRLVLGAFLLTLFKASATTVYVSSTSANPMAPYISWATAATNIQDAVDVAANGDTVLVTNGVYGFGGRPVGTALLTNRVAIEKPIVLASVNGPALTIIEGYRLPGTETGDGAVRCVYMASGAVLSGFTLRFGATLRSGDFTTEQTGGGAWCESAASIITNCAIAANSAASGSGGVYGGTLNNCKLTANSAPWGGGASMATLNNCIVASNTVIYSGGGALSCTLNNCTVVLNSARSYQGGGIIGSTATNCILYYNAAPDGPNYFDQCLGCASPSFCCTTPLPYSGPFGGVGNITNEPVFVNPSALNLHLQPASPCINAGNNAFATGATDLDGNPRISGGVVDMGAYEFQFSGPPVIAVQPADQKAIPGSNVTFTVVARGALPLSYQWQFTGTDIANATDSSLMLNAVTTSQAGLYSVVVTNALGKVTSAQARLSLWPDGVAYVWQDSPTPTPPYVSWATAAHTIQDAVDEAVPGLVVLVTNGTYAVGGRVTVVTGLALTNRIVVDKPITLKSVNGPQFTSIEGFQVPGTINGPAAVRCLYLTDGAAVSGFTLTNGATSPIGLEDDRIAGAAWCQSTNTTFTNCILAGNAGSAQAGAVYRGTLIDCVLIGNVAKGDDGSGGSYAGGALMSTLIRCTLSGNSAEGGLGWGGGAEGSTLFDCTLINNSASYAGGGVYSCGLFNCAVSGNSAQYGGGASSSGFTNCTVIGNSATGGGGVVNSSLLNSILYYNTSLDANANYDSISTFRFTCTTPLPASGPGNIVADPQLASASHLSEISPCRGAGLAGTTVGTDIDGESWANPPSMGCDEYYTGAVTGPLNVAIGAAVTNLLVGGPLSLAALIQGRASVSFWDFGDGVIVSNRPYASHAWATAGDYLVTLRAFNESQPGGVAATVAIHVSSKLLHYVSTVSTNQVSPFTSWATAATNIQSAIDAAASGDLLLVTNGLYAGGVTVSKPLTLLSVNGAQSTIIDGAGKTQCIYLTDGVSLSGFTLTNGFAGTGGGLGCSSIGAYVTNCVIVGNVATNGGGASGGTLYNCLLTRNSVSAAQYGVAGGAYGSVLYNCTVSENQAYQFGGVYSRVAAYNSIIYNNTAQVYPNFWDGMFLYYCCASPMPTNGVGNITNAPFFVNEVTGDFHLQSGSLCVDAGNTAFVTNTTDLDGNPRISGGSVDMGAYEFRSSGPPLITLQPVSQTVAVGADVTFTVGATGSSPLFWQWLFNGTPILAQTNSSLTLKSVTMQQSGTYSVIVSNSLGKITSTPANLTVRQSGASYVWQNSPNPTPPYNTWSTAATNIQDAVNSSLPGGLVLVTNGVYPGGVSLDRPLTVFSVNGPQVTRIDGGGANRCITMTNGASLSGFTLTNGYAQQGGAVWCSSTNAYITNCMIIGNVAAAGGGAFAGTLYNCQLSANSATSGGGGGSYASMLYNCTVSGNSAITGGGVFSGGFYNSIIYFNSAPFGPSFANNFTSIFYMVNCCTTPDPGFGSGNITSDPQFESAAGNLHLQSDSPCINGGDNSFVHGTTDLDGNPRLFDGTVDIGAYEFQSPIAPVILQQPLSQAANAGDITLFAVSARGTLPLYWQWRFKGANIPNATNSILTLGPLMTNQAGGYSVVITNFVGSVTSQVATLTVQGAPPVITQQLLSQTVYVGSNVLFTIGTASVLPLSWQWQFNGADTLASTGSTLILPSVTLKQAGAYSVIVTNFLGSVTSQVATLTVLDAAPTITLQPLNQTTYAGGTVTFTAGATGSQPFSWQWRFNGTAIPGATGSSFTLAGVTPDQAGAYSVVVTNVLGSATSADAILTVTQPVTSYVWQDSPSPTPPYTNWATAAHVIQDAVDAASAGYIIIVTNGVYATGGRTVGTGLLTNRLVLDKPLTVRSVNGPDVTVIQGYQVPGTTNGDAAVRCVYVSTNIVLSGFTLTNGATVQTSPHGYTDMSGGGVYSELWNNCVLMNCKLLGNSAADSGGGAFLCPLYNCLVAGNSAENSAGGTCFCAVTNSTIVHNSGFYGGGATVGILFNSIIYYNTNASFLGDADWVADKGGMIVRCCTTAFGLPEWQNTDAAPLFVDEPNGDFHLQPGSPCINSGDNAYVTSATDLDGNPRIFGGTVDIGAYEYQGSVIPLAWLQHYGLPTDGSADFVDADGDGLNNWQEWVCGTNPTNALSALRVLSATGDRSGTVTVTWQSVAGINYFVERTTALILPFTSSDTNRIAVATNVVGQAGTTTCTDTRAAGTGPFFYRIGVKPQ